MNTRPGAAEAVLYDGAPPALSQDYLGALLHRQPAPDTDLATGGGRPHAAGSVADGHVPAAQPMVHAQPGSTNPTPAGHSDGPPSRVLPDSVLPPNLATLSIEDLRNLQHHFVKYFTLDKEAKQAALELELKYHADMHRLAMKHQVLADQLLKHLGNGRRLRGPTPYNRFYAYAPAARAIHKAVTPAGELKKPIGQRSREIGALWRGLTPEERAQWKDPEYYGALIELAARADLAARKEQKGTDEGTDEEHASEDGESDDESGQAAGTVTGTKTRRRHGAYDYKAWASDVHIKMKAMRITEGFEAFMVITPYDVSRQTIIVATPAGDKYLAMLREPPRHQSIGEDGRLQASPRSAGPPRMSQVDEFAVYVTGKAVEAKLHGVDLCKIIAPSAPTGQGGHVAPELAHLAAGKVRDIKRPLTTALGDLLSAACGGAYKKAWPGEQTEAKLRESHGVEIVIAEHATGFDKAILLKPGRNWVKDDMLRLKHALDNNWISLRKLPEPGVVGGGLKRKPPRKGKERATKPRKKAARKPLRISKGRIVDNSDSSDDSDMHVD